MAYLVDYNAAPCVVTLYFTPGARFSKLPVITGPVKLFCFPFQMGVSKLLKIIQ